MTEQVSNEAAKTRPTNWVPWMHVAGVAYPIAVWLFMMGMFVGSLFLWAGILGLISFTVATAAFIGGIGRYLETKRS